RRLRIRRGRSSSDRAGQRPAAAAAPTRLVRAERTAHRPRGRIELHCDCRWCAGRPARLGDLEDTMIRLKEIGHVLLRVLDLERSKTFYSEVLGFHVLEEDPEHGGTFMALKGQSHSID